MVEGVVDCGGDKGCYTVVIRRGYESRPGKAEVPGSNPGGGSTPNPIILESHRPVLDLLTRASTLRA